ncbi:MAG: redox-sensing transcriptional repressor Rex [bacterium]
MADKSSKSENFVKLAPRPVVTRLSLYLRQLEILQAAGQTCVSSNKIAKILQLSDAQVRKDLAFFGQFGHPGIGYKIDELQVSIRKALGTDKLWPLAIVGFGNLGRALMRYREFDRHGFRIAAVFDSDLKKIGSPANDLEIYPIARLGEICKRQGVSIAALTVPAEVAQDVAIEIINSGIRGILNFAPVVLRVPESVSVVSVDLSVQLEQLVYKVSHGVGNQPGR